MPFSVVVPPPFTLPIHSCCYTCKPLFEQDVARVEARMGKEAVGRMLETVSGEAALNGRPWWLDDK